MSKHHGRLELGSPVDYGANAVQKRLGKLYNHVDVKGKRILDIGCGNGSYTTVMARASSYTVGIDIESERLSTYKKVLDDEWASGALLNNRILRASASSLPFVDSTFDIITMIEVLEHVDSEVETLKGCYRVLNKGGSVAIFAPNKFYPFETHGATVGPLKLGNRMPFISWLPDCVHSKVAHARIYTAGKLKSLVESCGFKVELVGYFYPPLDKIPLPVAFKKLYRKWSPKLETSFLKIFGVSIFLVGRKL